MSSPALLGIVSVRNTPFLRNCDKMYGAVNYFYSNPFYLPDIFPSILMKRIFTLLAAVFCLNGLAVAQNSTCGFDVMHAARMAADPAYAQKVHAFDSTQAWEQQNLPQGLVVNTPAGVVYEIPVVVHVIHTGQAVGTALNPSDAAITAWINYISQVFQAQYAGYPGPSNGGTAFPMRFVLAKRDTACNATTGIFRVNGSSVPGYSAEGINADNTTGADENDIKALSRFPTDRYYNIWIVTEIDNNNGGAGIQGYAYMASSAGDPWDGAVCQASTVAVGNETLPHEMGHAFNLYHTFEDDNNGTSCPPNTNCNTQGDRVCDTDPHIQSFGCPTGTNPCTSAPFGNVTFNIMNYTNCTDRFTVGQRTRAVAAATGPRASLSASLGSLAPGVVPATACIPTISNPGTTANAGPRRVIFNTLNVASSGYNGDGNKVHYDRTCEFGTEVLAGQSYTISVQTGGAPQQVRAYLDYDNDGDFSDPGEDIFVSSSTTALHTGTVAVPTTGVSYCTALRMRVVADLASAATVSACGPLASGQAEDYLVFVRAAPAAAALTVNPSGPSCTGDPLTFSIAPAVGITVTSVAWQVNGNTVATTTALSYTSATFADADVVTAKIFYNGPCGADSSVSNSITVVRASTVPPTVTIALTGGTNPACAGEALTFTATGTNTGTSPQYQWLINGTPVVGANSSTFTTTTLANGDAVSVYMLSSSSCANPVDATSLPIVITYGPVTPTVTITQTAGNIPLCAGKPATFTATPYGGGATPTYVWFVNGNGVPGVTGSTFTTTALQDGDTIRVLLTSSSLCAIPTTFLSAGYGVDVVPTDTPTLSVTLTAGANPGCRDSLLAWTAAVTNLGPAETINWLLDGVSVATGNSFSSTTLPNGGVLQVRAVAGTSACRTTDTLFSAPINLVRNSTPTAPIISYIGNNLVSNITPVQWYGPSGMITGATGGSYVPTTPGNYYARSVNGACGSRPSNILNVSLLDIADRNMKDVRLFPNPAKNTVTIDWGSKQTTAEISVCNTVGQVLLHDAVKAAATKTLDLSSLAPGTYFIVVQTADGVGAMPVTLMK